MGRLALEKNRKEKRFKGKKNRGIKNEIRIRK